MIYGNSGINKDCRISVQEFVNRIKTYLQEYIDAQHKYFWKLSHIYVLPRHCPDLQTNELRNLRFNRRSIAAVISRSSNSDQRLCIALQRCDYTYKTELVLFLAVLENCLSHGSKRDTQGDVNDLQTSITRRNETQTTFGVGCHTTFIVE